MTAAALQPMPKAAPFKSEDVGIPVRKMDMTFDDSVPEFWYDNNPLLTLFFGGFSATFPEGEKQFIYTVRAYQDKITEPVLRAQVRGFIGQEAHHSKEHDILNNCMRRKGYDLDTIERHIRSLNEWMQKNQSPAKQLAGTVCAEHITALMADYFLRKDPEALTKVDPSVRTLWAWHAIEETEHKSVAFDVYMQFVGDRGLLRRTMLEMTLMFISLNSYHTVQLIRQSGRVRDFRMWRKGSRALFKMAGALWSDYWDFYRRDFHPWQHDNRTAVAAMKQKYLGETA